MAPREDEPVLGGAGVGLGAGSGVAARLPGHVIAEVEEVRLPAARQGADAPAAGERVVPRGAAAGVVAPIGDHDAAPVLEGDDAAEPALVHGVPRARADDGHGVVPDRLGLRRRGSAGRSPPPAGPPSVDGRSVGSSAGHVISEMGAGTVGAAEAGSTPPTPGAWGRSIPCPAATGMRARGSTGPSGSGSAAPPAAGGRAADAPPAATGAPASSPSALAPRRSIHLVWPPPAARSPPSWATPRFRITSVAPPRAVVAPAPGSGISSSASVRLPAGRTRTTAPPLAIAIAFSAGPSVVAALPAGPRPPAGGRLVRPLVGTMSAE